MPEDKKFFIEEVLRDNYSRVDREFVDKVIDRLGDNWEGLVDEELIHLVIDTADEVYSEL